MSPAPAGELEIVVPLQVDRALVGLTLYAQAIVVDPEGRDHLTGTIALPIQ